MTYLRELDPDDATAIADLEAKHHPPELTDPAEVHRHHLNEALEARVNLSFGMFDRGRMVGYLLCFGFEPSIFPGNNGEAIYVEDVVIEPRFRRQLPRLFLRLRDEIQHHFPGAFIEAHAVESTFRFWQRHQALFADHGVSLLEHEPSGETIRDEPRFRLRWRVDMQKAPARQLNELLDRLPATRITHENEEIEVHLLQSEEYWNSLSETWDELLLRTPGHSVFQSYTYQRLWWNHHRADGSLYVIALRGGGSVLGIAPLQTIPTRIAGRWLRELCYIGSRWEVDRPVMLFGNASLPLVEVLVRFLKQRAADWDLCSLYEQGATDNQTIALRSAFKRHGYLVGQSRDSWCPYLQLQDSSWQELLASKSQKFRKNLKAAARRLQSEGTVEYHLYDSEDEVITQLQRYRDIEARSWKEKEGVGVSRSESYFDFYLELARLFSREKAFFIRMLTLDGEPIAGTFGLNFDGVYYSLQITHDSAYDRCSPGTYLESLEIEECFRQDCREYEFLGGFLNNKARWTDTFRETCQLHVYRRTPLLWAFYTIYFLIKPPAKKLIYRLTRRQLHKE